MPKIAFALNSLKPGRSKRQKKLHLVSEAELSGGDAQAGRALITGLGVEKPFLEMQDSQPEVT